MLCTQHCPSLLSSLNFPLILLCPSKYKSFRSGPVLSIIFAWCYQKQNTNDDNNAAVCSLCCAKQAAVNEPRERVLGQRAVVAASPLVWWGDTVLAPEISPRKGSLQLSAAAGKDLAQLETKQYGKPRLDSWGSCGKSCWTLAWAARPSFAKMKKKRKVISLKPLMLNTKSSVKV